MMFKKVILWILNTFGWLIVTYVAVTTGYLMFKDYQMCQLAYIGQTPEFYKVFFYYYTIIKITEASVIVYEYNLLSHKKNRGLLILSLFVFNFLILDIPVILLSGDKPSLFWWGLPILIYIVCTTVFITWIHRRQQH